MADAMRALGQALWADGGTLLASGAALLALVGMGEGLRALGWTARSSRNIVHAGVGLFVASTPLLFAGPVPVYLLAVAFVLINTAAWQGGWWAGIHGDGASSWGTVTFPLALLPALAATWSLDPDRLFALQTAFLVLAVADPMAAWVGTARGAASSYQLGSTSKSIPGSIAFALTSWIVATGALLIFNRTSALPWSLVEVLAAGSLVALMSTVVEALSGRGWDNLFIVVAVLAVLLPLAHHPEQWPVLVLAVAAGGVFAGVAYSLQALDASGAVAGGLLAAALVGLGGWAWIVPGLVFFVLSSALSRIGQGLKHELHQRSEKGVVRDAGQVYANGGVAWGLLLVYVAAPHPDLWIGFLGAFAAAAADTWATELGALSPRQPRSLRTGRRVPRGTSGAVSLTGTLASLGGAASIGLSAAPFLAEIEGLVPAWAGVAIVVGSGVVGAIADSLAGATVQVQYRDPETGALVEQPRREGEALERVRGWAGITNDRVNGIGTAAGALTAILGAALVLG